MESWEQRLKAEFTNSAKSVIIGIGNDLKADDGIGPHIITHLKNQVSPEIELINAHTVPENFINFLIEKQPEFILLIDAALM